MKKFLTISVLAVLLASAGGPVVLASDADSNSASIPIFQIPFTFTSDGTFDTTGMVTTVGAVIDAVIGGTTTGNAGSTGVVTTAGIGSAGSIDYGSK